MKLLSIILLASVLVVAGCATEEIQEEFFVEEEPFEEPIIEQGAIPDEEVDEVPIIEQGAVPDEEEVVSDEDVVEQEIVEEASEGMVRIIEVEGGMYYFEPSVIEVEVGETIEFVFNNVQGLHDMWIPSLEVGTSVIGSGQTESFTHTFDEAGTFEFICTVGTHAAQGMVGEIIVS